MRQQLLESNLPSPADWGSIPKNKPCSVLPGSVSALPQSQAGMNQSEHYFWGLKRWRPHQQLSSRPDNGGSSQTPSGSPRRTDQKPSCPLRRCQSVASLLSGCSICSEEKKEGGSFNKPDILKTCSATVVVFLLLCRPKSFRHLLSPTYASTLRWFTRDTVGFFQIPPGARNEPVQKVGLLRRETDLSSGRGARVPHP